ncbi:MAG: ComEC/Rec2 family competence protein [Bacteroidales bacterium]
MSGLINDMKKVPVTKALLPFVAGLAVSGGLPEDNAFEHYFLLASMLLILMVGIYYMTSKGFSLGNVFFVSGTFLFFFLSGIISMKIPQFSYQAELNEREGFILGIIKDGMVERDRSWVVPLETMLFADDSVDIHLRENMQVYIRKGMEMPDLVPGEKWLFHGKTVAIKNSGNPGEFDYRSYMLRRKFRYNLFVSSSAFISPVAQKSSHLKFIPSEVRHRIMTGWDSNDPNVAVLSAVTVGYKSWLDRETKKQYSDAGAMHLLAVSGLHVGMVWWILDMLLRFPLHPRFWRTGKLILILGILWFYAGITGFSESVTRSVTMFSLVSFARTLNRNSNIYNTLLLSAFVLLILKPARIMEPGFQLSYIAVFGIVSIQPELEKLYLNLKKPLKRVLDLVSVSIAAQLSTLPLVLLYFHQFPTWFLLTNIVAIPLVSLMLALFVIFAPFLIILSDPAFFAMILVKLAGVLNYLIGGISSLPGAVITDISMNGTLATGIMVSVLLLISLLTYRRFFYLLALAATMTITIGYSSMNLFEIERSSSLEIYNFNSVTVVSHLQNAARHTYMITSDDDADPYVIDYIRSLKLVPGPLRRHAITKLSTRENEDEAVSYLLRDGLWGIGTGKTDILIIGKCTPANLRLVLMNYSWDLLLFRTGFSKIEGIDHLVGNDVKIIADGTVRDFEKGMLEEMFSGVYFIREQGAFIFSLRTPET